MFIYIIITYNLPIRRLLFKICCSILKDFMDLWLMKYDILHKKYE